MVPVDRTLNRIRTFLLGIVLLGILATGGELILLEHTEELAQWLPLALLGLGLAGLLALAVRPSAGTFLVFRALMVCFVAAGVAGVWLHYRGNVEFELEMYPGLEGVALFRKAIAGATPALAPGMMLHLGLLGLIYTYRHPNLGGAPGGAAGPHSSRRSP